jgi:hypothetical protein
MRSSTHLPSLLGTLLFTAGVILLISVAFVLGVVVLGDLLAGKTPLVRETVLLAVTGFEGLLLGAAAFFSFQKLIQNPSADRESSFTISVWQIAVCLIVAGAALLLGWKVFENASINWLMLPILTLPAVVLPILVLFGLGVRHIPLGSRWRTWNVLGISMTLVPIITVILEIIVAVIVIILAALYISTQPRLMAQVEILATKIYTGETNPEAILGLVAPLLLKPGVLAIALSYFSLMIPLIEELVKPLGVWLFANQIHSRAQGFALGALGGATYALIETLGVSPQSADWTATLLTRLGTDILHVTTSALMGAAIVYAIQERQYLRLVGTYLLCVFLHGLWNSLAILFTFSTLAVQYGQNLLTGAAVPATVAVATLAVCLLLLLIFSNRRMKAARPMPVPEDLVL